MTVLEVDRRQVLAYRVAAHGLHRDIGEDLAGLRAFDLGVQHAHPDSARLAITARTRQPVTDLLDREEFAIVWSFRGAPHLLRRADVATIAGELWPWSEADAEARLGEWRELKKSGDSALQAFTRVAEALRAVVTDATPKGEVSRAVSDRLPEKYGYRCRSCQAHHIYGGIFQQAGIFAGVRVLPGRSPTMLAPLADRFPVPTGNTGPRGLPLSYLGLHGPATITEAAAYLGTTRAQARPVWPEDLVEIRFDGRTTYLPVERVDELRNAPAPDLVRLLPPLDPYLQARDREVIVPGQAHRKDLWRVLGNPGAVLAGGEIAGSWRAKSTAKKTTITVSPYARLDNATKAAITEEANTIATLRGTAEAVVRYD
jgi:hypothetical protein